MEEFAVVEEAEFIVDPLELEKLKEFSNLLVQFVCEIDNKWKDVATSRSQDSEILRQGLDRHHGLIQKLDSGLSSQKDSFVALASQVKVHKIEADEQRAALESVQKDLEQLGTSTKEDLYKLETTLEATLAQSIQDAVASQSPALGTDTLPTITAESASDEVIQNLLARQQALENKVAGQDAALKGMQRTVTDTKGINQEIYMTLSNKLGKLEKQAEAQQRSATRLEDDLVELMATQENTQAQVDELAKALKVQVSPSSRPESAQPSPEPLRVGMTAAETAELVWTILASLPSRPQSAATRRPPTGQSAEDQPIKPQYALTEPAKSQRSETEVVKHPRPGPPPADALLSRDQLTDRDQSRYPAAAGAASVENSPASSTLPVMGSIAAPVDSNPVSSALPVMGSIAAPVDSSPASSTPPVVGSIAAPVEYSLTRSTPPVIGFIDERETPNSTVPLPSDVVYCPPTDASDEPEALRVTVQDILERVCGGESSHKLLRHQFDVLVESLRGMSSLMSASLTGRRFMAGGATGGALPLSNIPEEIVPASSGVSITIGEEGGETSDLSTLTPSGPHVAEGKSRRAGTDHDAHTDTQELKEQLEDVVDLLVGLSNTAQSIHAEQPARVKIVHRRGEISQLPQLGMDSAESSVAQTEFDDMSSRRDSEITANIYPSVLPVVLSHNHVSEESDAVSEMGSMSYVDEALTEKVHNLDKRLHLAEKTSLDTSAKLQSALESIRGLKAANNKLKPRSDTQVGATSSPRLLDMRDDYNKITERLLAIETVIMGNGANFDTDNVIPEEPSQVFSTEPPTPSSPPILDYPDPLEFCPAPPLGEGCKESMDEEIPDKNDRAESATGTDQDLSASNQMSEVGGRLTILEKQLKDLRCAQGSATYAAMGDVQELSERLTVELSATQRLIAKNAAAAVEMIAEVSDKSMARTELVDRFESVNSHLDHLRSVVNSCAGRADLDNALNSITQQTRSIKSNMVDKRLLNDRLVHKADKMELDKLVAGISSIIGDPLQTGAAAAMHKCLVCDKPVNSYDPNSPSSVLTRPVTAVVGYDKVDDPRFAVPPSPIKKPSSSHHSSRQSSRGGTRTLSGGTDRGGSMTGATSPNPQHSVVGGDSPAADATAYTLANPMMPYTQVTMMAHSFDPQHSIAPKKLNPIAAKNSALAQRLRSGAGGGATGSYKVDTR